MTSGDREAAAQFFDKLAAKAEKSINSAEVRHDAEAVENIKRKSSYYKLAAAELRGAARQDQN